MSCLTGSSGEKVQHRLSLRANGTIRRQAGRYELTLREIPGPPEPERFPTESSNMCADSSKKSGGTAYLMVVQPYLMVQTIWRKDHLQPGPDANLPIAHRLADFSP
jgi:hypothetical protein